MNELLRRLLLLPEQATLLARQIDGLHYLVIGTALLGALATLMVTAFFLVRYRRGARAGSRIPPLATWIEAAFCGGLLCMFVAFWSVGAMQYLELTTPPEKALIVYVVGKQWMWSFAYADGSATNHDLVVPQGQAIKLILTSRDVIHSFYVPAFRIKQDAVPARSTIAWFRAESLGDYDILCAEYCGLSHSRMRGRVRVMRPEEFEAWREGRSPLVSRSRPLAQAERSSRLEPSASLAQAGERIAAERGCLRCHTLDGTPHLGPTWAGLYRSSVPLQGGGSALADEAFLTRAMMDPAAEVHRGFAPMMPSYLGLLSATDSAALLELIRRLGTKRAGGAGASPLPSRTTEAINMPVEPGAAHASRLEVEPTVQVEEQP